MMAYQQLPHRCDARDLSALDLIAQGTSLSEAARTVGMSRGPLSRMWNDIKRDMANDVE